jgi:hypothetical protein
MSSGAVQEKPAPRRRAGMVYPVPLTHFRKPAVMDFLRENPDALELSVLSTNFLCQYDTEAKVAAALPVLAGVVACFIAPAAAPFLFGGGVFGGLGVLASEKPHIIVERLPGLRQFATPLPLNLFLELKDVQAVDLIGLVCEDGLATQLASIAAGAPFEQEPDTRVGRCGSEDSIKLNSRDSTAVGGGLRRRTAAISNHPEAATSSGPTEESESSE